jgi:SAM-dependent methyltransferase
MTVSLQGEIASDYYRTTAYRGHSPTREYYEEAALGILRRLRAWLPANRNAACLDLACGCGETIYALEQAGFVNTSGVDLCGEEVAYGRKYVKGTLFCADALSYLRGLDARSLDFITALNFLEHFDKDILLRILRECERVLRPGGTMVAMVPNAISPFGSLTRHWDITHEWSFVPNNIYQLAALAGFAANVEFRECGPIAHGFKSGLRYLAWQFIRALIAAYLVVEVGDTKGGIYSMDMLFRLAVATSSSSTNSVTGSKRSIGNNTELPVPVTYLKAIARRLGLSHPS